MSRSHGRNKKKCDRYRNEGRWEKSHARRALRHMRRHMKDSKPEVVTAYLVSLPESYRSTVEKAWDSGGKI